MDVQYFIITFDVRKRRSHFHECVIAFMYKRGIAWPHWLEKHDTLWRPRHRTVGYYHTFEEAVECVEEAAAHLSEGETNEYVLIERVPVGMYPSVNRTKRGFAEMQWYRLNFDTEEYEPCERPDLDVDGWAQTSQFCF